ncbi:MAG: bacterial transcriptional activator domain-containing protein [Desulfitobacteriaceae bacterium]
MEPGNEEVCRQSMDLLWQNGQKQQALSLYHELATALAKEYDVLPAEETNDLYEKILGS